MRPGPDWTRRDLAAPRAGLDPEGSDCAPGRIGPGGLCTSPRPDWTWRARTRALPVSGRIGPRGRRVEGLCPGARLGRLSWSPEANPLSKGQTGRIRLSGDRGAADRDGKLGAPGERPGCQGSRCGGVRTRGGRGPRGARPTRRPRIGHSAGLPRPRGAACWTGGRGADPGAWPISRGDRGWCK